MPSLSFQCISCKNYIGAKTCEAFIDEDIPDVILTGEHDHRKPFEGDGGIGWEAIDESSEILVEGGSEAEG